MTTYRRLMVAAVFLATVGCANRVPSTRPDAVLVVERFVDAYNRHAVTEMLALAQDSVELMRIAGAVLAVDAAGKPALGNALDNYFARFPTARSELLSVHAVGRFVTTDERAVWENGTRSQRSVGVYEVDETGIRRVWYFPAVRPER